MRVLQLVTRNEMRGAEVFAAQLSDALVDRGHVVVQAGLYAMRSSTDVPLSFAHATSVDLGGRNQGRIEPRVLWRLKSLVKSFQPNVIQANGFHALKYSSLLKRLTRARWSLFYRNISMASVWIRGRLQLRWGRWIVNPVRTVLSVSDATAADFSKTYQLPRERVITIRRGVEIPSDPGADIARRVVCGLTGAQLTDPLLFHVGGFTAEKNHVGLLTAFGHILTDWPSAHLVLCGDGPLREVIAASVQVERFDGHVHLLGNRADARDLLAGADLLLLPSQVEGIPGVVLEAGARGVPSICTNVGAVSEVIENGKSGILVAPGNVREMAQAACDLLGDAVRRQAMGTSARQRVREQHDMRRTVDRFVQAYRLAITT